ncbi:siphovirus ReqiPepy6 Gp37-like family protein [Caldifermentibacillus hisashii]|uniref:siphovirus ReqiPepy6 Gp37-like family protein n=1 Tax=Caldifermentibacillus hisashii TaxID=996558 RepID=UPI0031015019
MDFYIFDLRFNFHGILDDYVSVPITRSYVKKTSFTISVPPSAKNLSLLKKGRLMAKQNDLEHAYIIETIEYADGNDNSLMATVFSLHHLLKKRIVLGQQSFNGPIGQVMSNFVIANAVNPVNTNRIIPSLVISADNNFGPITTETCLDEQLDDWLFEIGNKFGVSWDILFDYEHKQFIFKVWQGVDRSEKQNANSRVIFAKEFDNVISQDYVDSDSDYRSTAIVAGEGEGAERKRVTVNDEKSGFERDELFVDARDLQSTYQDENGQEVTIPTSEYESVLIERGKNKLSEHQKIQTLDSELDFNSSFKYERDFFLGDIISVKNTKLGLILHTRITQVVETYSKEGKTLKAEFGSNIPSIIDKIKKAVK